MYTYQPWMNVGGGSGPQRLTGTNLSYCTIIIRNWPARLPAVAFFLAFKLKLQVLPSITELRCPRPVLMVSPSLSPIRHIPYYISTQTAFLPTDDDYRCLRGVYEWISRRIFHIIHRGVGCVPT